MSIYYRKITPVNGFDAENPDNAKQNNYAWAMTELGDYLYVGTARNILYSILDSGLVGDVTIPDILAPEDVDMNGEIWRYKKDGTEQWERVYKASDELVTFGFRFMTTYTTPDGETALYAIAYSLIPQIIIVKSTDGVHWRVLDSGITDGFSARTMIEYKGRLYMGVMEIEVQTQSRTLLYTSSDPEKYQWELVDTAGVDGLNPRGEITEMISFNNRLYVGTSRAGGFELWKTEGEVPARDQWRLVVDQGAGDALNEVPMSMVVFNNHIYLGTAIWAAVSSVDPEKTVIPPKGFDLIRVDTDDNWELVIGGPPIFPTEPTTGKRGIPLSRYPSGFGTITNAYCWQLRVHQGELYLGTMDWSVTLPVLLPVAIDVIKGLFPYNLDSLMTNLLYAIQPHLLSLPIEQIIIELGNIVFRVWGRSFGFDLWKSPDGIYWTPISKNGLGNPYNYGARTLLSSEDGRLYLGTANPFQGCEVWVEERLDWWWDEFPYFLEPEEESN